MPRATKPPPNLAPTTLRDVAERVGMHPATVSRALNDRTRHLVSADTAHRVRKAARDLGYTPNSIARSLKTKRSMAIGVILPDLTNPLFPPMVRGIEDALAAAGFTALIANTDNDQDRARAVFEAFRFRKVDGWISAVATLHENIFADGVTPLVLLMVQDGLGTPCVVGDDRSGITQAIDHLIALGHRRIGLIGGPLEVSTGFARHAAYVDVMKRRGLEPSSDLVRVGESFSEEEGASALRDLLACGGEFSAILAGNDLMALGCYKMLAERGLRCPQDVSVVGFNDMHFADIVFPPLTTVKIPHHAMGHWAAEQLLAQISGTSMGPSRVVLPAELVVRESTKPPGARRRTADSSAGRGERAGHQL